MQKCFEGCVTAPKILLRSNLLISHNAPIDYMPSWCFLIGCALRNWKVRKTFPNNEKFALKWRLKSYILPCFFWQKLKSHKSPLCLPFFEDETRMSFIISLKFHPMNIKMYFYGKRVSEKAHIFFCISHESWPFIYWLDYINVGKAVSHIKAKLGLGKCVQYFLKINF